MVGEGVRRVTWQVDRRSRRGSGDVYQPCVQDTRTIAHRGAQDRGRMASKLIGTLLSSQVTDARTTRPRVFTLIGCDPALSGLAVFLLSCCALDLSRSAALSQFLAILTSGWFLSPSAFPILADRFRVLRFHLAFATASGLPFRCGAPELYRYLFPSPNRPFAGRSRRDIQVPTPRDHDAVDAVWPTKRPVATTRRSELVLAEDHPG